MRIVIDSNVFISAFYFGGKPKGVVARAAEGLDELFLSYDIIGEIQQVMSRPKFKTDIMAVKQYAAMIEEISDIVAPSLSVDVSRDKKDNKIIECAVCAKADYIVTGDEDLLSLKSYQGIKIVSAADYLKLF